MTQVRRKGGAAPVAPPSLRVFLAVGGDDTYSRVRAVCTAGARGFDLDKHAAQITEVVALARTRGEAEFSGRDEVPAP